MSNPVNDLCIYRVSCCDFLKEPCSKEKYEKCKARSNKTINYGIENYALYHFNAGESTYPYESVCDKCPGNDICLWSDKKYGEKDGKIVIRVACNATFRHDTFNKLIEMKEKKGDS